MILSRWKIERKNDDEYLIHQLVIFVIKSPEYNNVRRFAIPCLFLHLKNSFKLIYRDEIFSSRGDPIIRLKYYIMLVCNVS